jgi:hypothetical protein
MLANIPIMAPARTLFIGGPLTRTARITDIINNMRVIRKMGIMDLIAITISIPKFVLMTHRSWVAGLATGASLTSIAFESI